MSDDVTLGEVARRVDSVLAEVREMRRDVIGRREYESDQEGNATRHLAHEKALREWKETSTEAHVELGGRIAAIGTRLDTQEKVAKESRGKWILALTMAVVGPILGLLVSLAFRGVG